MQGLVTVGFQRFVQQTSVVGVVGLVRFLLRQSAVRETRATARAANARSAPIQLGARRPAPAEMPSPPRPAVR